MEEKMIKVALRKAHTLLRIGHWMLQDNGGALVCMYGLALMKEITVLSNQRNRSFALKLLFFKEQRKR